MDQKGEAKLESGFNGVAFSAFMRIRHCNHFLRQEDRNNRIAAQIDCQRQPTGRAKRVNTEEPFPQGIRGGGVRSANVLVGTERNSTVNPADTRKKNRGLMKKVLSEPKVRVA
jgi:hypothetical protein